MYKLKVDRRGLVLLVVVAACIGSSLFVAGVLIGSSMRSELDLGRTVSSRGLVEEPSEQRDGPPDIARPDGRQRAVPSRSLPRARSEFSRWEAPPGARRRAPLGIYPPRLTLQARLSKTSARGNRTASPRLAFLPGQTIPRTPYGRLIYNVARLRSVNPSLVAAIIAVESNFDPHAVSRKGAIGLMQVLPATAQRFGIEPAQLADPVSNLHAGTEYLRWLGERYEKNLGLTLAAYNAGDGAVDRWRGVPPYPETRDYVRRVFSTYATLANDVSR